MKAKFDTVFRNKPYLQGKHLNISMVQKNIDKLFLINTEIPISMQLHLKLK